LSASRSGRFNPGVRVLGTHWIKGWVGLRAGLDTGGKSKNAIILMLIRLKINCTLIRTFVNFEKPFTESTEEAH